MCFKLLGVMENLNVDVYPIGAISRARIKYMTRPPLFKDKWKNHNGSEVSSASARDRRNSSAKRSQPMLLLQFPSLRTFPSSLQVFFIVLAAAYASSAKGPRKAECGFERVTRHHGGMQDTASNTTNTQHSSIFPGSLLYTSGEQ